MSKPTKYRKKPVTIEAIQFMADDATRGEQHESANAIIAWIKASDGRAYSSVSRAGRRITVVAPEGEIHAMPGDYIIKGVQGEFYPCKPDAFTKTYEPAK